MRIPAIFSRRRLKVFYTLFAFGVAAIAWRVIAVNRELQSEQDVLRQRITCGKVEYATRRFGIGRSLLRMISTDDFNTQHAIGIDAEGYSNTDKQIEQLQDFRFLQRLELAMNPIGDRAVESIVRSQYAYNLRYLDLGYTEISDESLALLNKLDSLETLILYDTKVSDIGLLKLKNNSLRVLDLSGTNITDVGLRHVANHFRVSEIGISQTNCTVEGVERFLSHPNNSKKGVTINMWVFDITDEQKRALVSRFPNAKILHSTNIRRPRSHF